MKFRILRNLPSNLVKERVPTKYKDLAVTCESQLLDTCSLIIFPHDKRNVVKSGLVEKSLKSLGESSDPQLVVVGSCFSVEATNLLNRKKAVFISLFEDHRKDSYQNKLHLEHVRY
ncbi:MULTISPECIES: hypothetical protein [unclassified Colwellia]|uniref:hypothetical protein n=1 Tax=unclassified Colwellia TaxID=196834 RepID=UPI0015F6FB62|nr:MULTISPECIES: hypothetical protein [unclassified Colwellia]MBA6234020.1 hypothetical protein [Colwellia sp. MB02u-7]MBA6238058.1 hypothetical protein [Colwellia sp. MB02u-11]MBA6300694.1 hypothetical protein [Colwellia sp. MB3u-22]MBA6304425.1 hypothetical protein [Colwellia sp. MB02u-14]MBA6311407.1 hypothetical protein [Colwellia sp. MB3u-64]